MTRAQIAAFLAVSVTLWASLLIVRDIPVTIELLWPFGLVISGVSLVMLVFDAWAWKLPALHGWLIKRPNIDGTWKTELQSDWIDPSTGKGIAPIHCFIVVRQTASALSIRLITPESKSETVSAGVEVCRDGSFEITCTYRNKPRSMYRYRSEVHYGAMLLHADGRYPHALEGDYWTDRNTTGHVKLTDRARGRPTTYEDANALFESAGGET